MHRQSSQSTFKNQQNHSSLLSDQNHSTVHMAWSEPEFLCRKHPNQIPQPGVCPSCLRERLSRIAASNNSHINSTIHPSSSPSFSSSPALMHDHCYSSASSSARSGSPTGPRRRGRHNRVGSDIMSSISWAVSGNDGSGLKKSRSIAFASRSDGVSVRKKKHGFWSKLLLRSNGKKP